MPAANLHVFVMSDGTQSEIIVPQLSRMGHVEYMTWGTTGMQSGLARLAGTAVGATMNGTLHVGAAFPHQPGQVEVKVSREELAAISAWLQAQRDFQAQHGYYPYSLWNNNCADFTCAALSAGGDRLSAIFQSRLADGPPTSDADRVNSIAALAEDPYTPYWLRNRTEFVAQTNRMREQLYHDWSQQLANEIVRRQRYAAMNDTRVAACMPALPYEGDSTVQPEPLGTGPQLSHPTSIAGMKDY